MNKVRKKKKILIPARFRKAIIAEFGCGQTTLYAALDYTSNSDQAKKIRFAAINRYEGVEVNVPILA